MGESDMVSEKIRINYPEGLSIRPSQLLIKALAAYNCDVMIRFGGREINARSIMNLLAAEIRKGSEIQIKCSGEKEEECLQAAVALLNSISC